MPETNTSHKQREGETESSLPEHIRELLAEVSNLEKTGADALTDTLAHWLTAHYVAAAKRAARNAGAKGMDLKTLRGLIADVVALRRGDHSAERLIIEREQLDLNRQLSKERIEKLFWEWATKPENKSRICRSSLSVAEQARRFRKIFHMPEPPKAEEPRGGLTAEALEQIEKAAKLL
jgi:hypothetical protein